VSIQVERLDGELTDDASRLAMALARLTRVLRRGNPTGLGSGSMSALATLVRSGPMRLGDLAAKESVAPPTMTRIVATLEEAGYVTRSADPTDRRATRAEATESAADLIAGRGSARTSLLRTRMEALPAEDLAALLRAVPVLETLAIDEG
jgi:DNA-binding MarR family transcriptional regulator